MNNEANNLEAWSDQAEIASETITIEMMDKAIEELKTLRDLYDQKNDELKEISASVDKLTDHVIKLLENSGKKSYKVDGIASVSLGFRQSYKVPSTPEAKVQLFNYIKNKYGEGTLLAMQGINSMTLNSWANKEFEQGVMAIDGLDQPTVTPRLSVRKG